MTKEEYHQRSEALSKAYDEHQKKGDELMSDGAIDDAKFNAWEKEVEALDKEHDILVKEFSNQVAEPMQQLTGEIDKLKQLQYRMNHPTKMDYVKAIIWNLGQLPKALWRAITP